MEKFKDHRFLSRMMSVLLSPNLPMRYKMYHAAVDKHPDPRFFAEKGEVENAERKIAFMRGLYGLGDVIELDEVCYTYFYGEICNALKDSSPKWKLMTLHFMMRRMKLLADYSSEGFSKGQPTKTWLSQHFGNFAALYVIWIFEHWDRIIQDGIPDFEVPAASLTEQIKLALKYLLTQGLVTFSYDLEQIPHAPVEGLPKDPKRRLWELVFTSGAENLDSHEQIALRQKTMEQLRSARLVSNTNHTELTIQPEFAEAYANGLGLEGRERIDFISRQNTDVNFDSENLYPIMRKFLSL